mgnify:CR=1 FL=1
MKKYEILGGNLPVVVCELAAGESMITESGSMSWMSPNMKMETVSGGGMKKMFGRMMSGDSAFQNRYRRNDCICIKFSGSNQSAGD